MNRLIVGVGQNDEARDALALAAALASAEDAELHVAVVFPFEVAMIDPADYERIRDEFFDDVLAAVADVLGGGHPTHRLDGASPPSALAHLAEELGADALVIGSAHRGPVGRVLIGGVGERLVQGAPCGVFVAPRGLAGREPTGFKRIGVGYDGTPESATALAAAARLAKELGASLRLIAVMPRFVTPGRISGTDAGYSRLVKEELEAALVEAERSVADVEADSVLSIGDPADELAAEAVGLDLLMVGSRGYGPLRRVLLGGVSAELMRSAPCPLAVVPRAPADDAPNGAGG